MTQSSIEAIDCTTLPPGSRLEIDTRNRRYDVECLGGNTIRISGHPQYCPFPVLGHVLRSGVIARGEHLQFLLEGNRPVTTTRVERLRLKHPTIQ